ncbi:MAG: hypothetical protein AABZ46_03285, partial [Nitrospirota bacterium]
MKTETETTEMGINGHPIDSGMAWWRSSRARQGFRNGLALVLLVTAPGIAIATQLNLATSPLFLTLNSKPNIVFLADDFASMDWAMVTTESDGVMTAGSCTYYYTHPTPNLGTGATPPAKNNSGDATDAPDGWIVPTEEYVTVTFGVTNPGLWRAWNKDYNKMYYNPSVTYSPWSGVDDAGTAYANASPTAAYYNPYHASHGNINLTTTKSYTTKYCPSSGTAFTITDYHPARYYVWSDTNSNGVVDASDSHTLVEIKSSTNSYTKASGRTDCAGSTCTYAEEIQNFANWFSYHRKRDLAMKAAVGKVVAPSSDRMAYAVLNNSAANVSILAMNASTTSGNKRTLLNGLYSTEP